MAVIPIVTPGLLHSIRNQPHLALHCWYLATISALNALGRPDEIPIVFKDALNSTPGLEERMVISRKTREALIKSSAIVGLPKTINAMLALKSATPTQLLDEPMAYSPSRRSIDIFDVPSPVILSRGRNFFDIIYGKISNRVMGMDRSGTEDLGLTARLMYGNGFVKPGIYFRYILSNLRVLNAKETSLVIIAALIPQDVNPQLKGHLKGALANGATVDEVRAVREIVVRVCEAASKSASGCTGPIANL